MNIRQQRIKANGGSLSKKDWNTLLVEADYKCQKCGSPDSLSFDHILPVYLGGKTDKENGQILCISCNTSKWANYADYREASPSGEFGENKKITKTDAVRLHSFLTHKYNIGIPASTLVGRTFKKLADTIESEYFYSCDIVELMDVAKVKEKTQPKRIKYVFPNWLLRLFGVKKIWQSREVK
jgi:hypothetical protein